MICFMSAIWHSCVSYALTLNVIFLMIVTGGEIGCRFLGCSVGWVRLLGVRVIAVVRPLIVVKIVGSIRLVLVTFQSYVGQFLSTFPFSP